MAGDRPPSGHVFRVVRARGPVLYAKYRLPDGRQVQKKLGPAWTERGRPPNGYFTKRLAEVWLRDTLDQARRGTLAGMNLSGATFADAAAEWIRFIAEDRERKPSTVRDYRNALEARLLPAFGSTPIRGTQSSGPTVRRILSNDGGFGLGGTSAGRLQHRSAWSVCLSLWRYSESWACRRQRRFGLRGGLVGAGSKLGHLVRGRCCPAGC